MCVCVAMVAMDTAQHITVIAATEAVAVEDVASEVVISSVLCLQ